MPNDLNRIRDNIASMLDQGATEREVEEYIAGEGTTAQALRGQMTPVDERSYAALAADPKSTAADLQAFARQRGFDVTDGDAAAFIAARSRKGAEVGSSVQYRQPAPAAAVEDPEALTGTNTFAQDVGAVAGDLADGILPGSAKTLRGFRGVAGNALSSVFGDDAFDPSAAYSDAVAEQGLVQARFNAEHPNWSAGLSATGMGLGIVALPQAKLLKGATLTRGALNSAVNGAGYGALAGGLLGAAAPVALHRAAETAAAARRNVPGLNGVLTAVGNAGRRLVGREAVPANAAAHAQAERLLGRTMEGATIDTGMGTGSVPGTPANVAAEVTRRQSLGTPAMPADVSGPLRRATAAAVKGEGRMASRARGILSARQAEQGSRIRGALAAELGDAVDPIAAAETITARAKAAAAPAYREAYAQPVVVTPEMAGIMRTPAFRDALPQAVRNIRNAGREPNALGFQVDAAGDITGLDTLSAEGFDQVVRAMKDSARSAAGSHPITGQPIHNTNSVHINARAKDLQGHLAAQNPAYGEAVNGYADEMAVRAALEGGVDVAKLSGPEIAAQLRTMPQHAQEAWTTGARSALADRATATGLNPAVNGVLSMRSSLGLSGAGLYASSGNVAKRGALETMSGRPGVLSRLDDRLEAENQAYETFGTTYRAGSPKGEESATLQAIGAALGPVRKAVLGNWAGALGDLALRGNSRGTAAFRRDVNEHTAALLTATAHQDVHSAMTAVAGRQATDQARRGALHSTASKLGRTGVLQGTAQSADPYVPDDVDD